MDAGVIAYASAPPQRPAVRVADIAWPALIGVAFAVACPLLLLTAINTIRLVHYGQFSCGTPLAVIGMVFAGGWCAVLGVRRLNAILSLLRKRR